MELRWSATAGDIMDVSLGLGVRRAPTTADVAMLVQDLQSPLSLPALEAVIAEFAAKKTVT